MENVQVKGFSIPKMLVGFSKPNLLKYKDKIEKEYLNVKIAIELLDFTLKATGEIEDALIAGIYKKHINLLIEPKIQKIYKGIDYEKLMNVYEDKITTISKKENKIVEFKNTKQMLHEVKQIEIDSISRDFANGNFDKIALIEIAQFKEKDIKKVYENAIVYINEQIESLPDDTKLMYLDNYLGKLQLHLSKYLVERENDKIKDINLNQIYGQRIKKFKYTIKQYILQLVNKIKGYKLIEENKDALEESNIRIEAKLTSMKYVLEKELKETNFYGAFSEGSLEDKIKIYNKDLNKGTISQYSEQTDSFRNFYLNSGRLVNS